LVGFCFCLVRLHFSQHFNYLLHLHSRMAS
jgi:hypothetical protein